MTLPNEQKDQKPSILHVCKREVLRPVRDQILRLSGFFVESTCQKQEALTMFQAHEFSLVLIDVEGEEGIPLAETLCEEVKKTRAHQAVAFVCNYRVAVMTDCPDHILRTEFDPAAFVAGVREMIK
jgi:DNA-binding NtrC family response regulator